MVLTKPCDKTRPQERGFNKRYRFLELRLGDFPEDRLCLAGGPCTAGTRLPLSSSAVFTAATLYLSLTTWKYSTPLDPAPTAWLSDQQHPRSGRARLVQRVLPSALGCSCPAAPGWALGVSKTHPLSSLPLTRPASKPGWTQICLSVTNRKRDTNLPPHFICPPDWDRLAGRHMISVSVLLFGPWKSREGEKKSHFGGDEGVIRKLGVLECHYVSVAGMTLE